MNVENNLIIGHEIYKTKNKKTQLETNINHNIEDQLAAAVHHSAVLAVRPHAVNTLKPIEIGPVAPAGKGQARVQFMIVQRKKVDHAKR